MFVVAFIINLGLIGSSSYFAYRAGQIDEMNKIRKEMEKHKHD
jgi:hypothetical protein